MIPTLNDFGKAEYNKFKEKYKHSSFREQGTPASKRALANNYRSWEPANINQLTDYKDLNRNSIVTEKATNAQFRFNLDVLIEYKRLYTEANPCTN